MVALSQLRDVAIAQAKKTQQALFELQAEVEKAEENEAELRDEKNQLERQLKKLESSHRIEKQVRRRLCRRPITCFTDGF